MLIDHQKKKQLLKGEKGSYTDYIRLNNFFNADRSHQSNSSMSFSTVNISNQILTRTIIAGDGQKNNIRVTHRKNLNSFYNFSEDAPMKFRIYLFRQQFQEFSTLKQDQCIKLIQLYDKNLNRSHETNSSSFAIIGGLFLYTGWLMLNASSVF